MDFLNPTNFLLIGGILLFISIIVSKAGAKYGVPALLLFLGVGMAAGCDGFGIEFSSNTVVQFLGTVALSVILFSGGMDTKYKDIRPVLAPGILLASLGVLLTTLITGYFIYLIFSISPTGIHFSLLESMLMAAVMSSTDSASVFSILRSKHVGLKERLRPMLELESGSNDPMAYLLTVILTQIVVSNSGIGDVSWGYTAFLFVAQLVVGGLLGMALGYAIVWFMNRINLSNDSLYPILLLAFVFFVFAITDLLRGNGYLAVYIAGLMVGNKRLVHKRSIASFFDGFTWLFQIVMFVMLGLLVVPSEMWQVAVVGLLIAVFMILVARPVAVFACLLPFRKLSFRARTYVSWVGLRGAVPIIFAIYPLVADPGNENFRIIFNIVFFITIVSLLLQGTTVNLMAKWLGLSEEYTDKKEFNVNLPDEIKSAMSEVEVIPSALANGDKLMNFALPDNTLVVMVKRDGHYFVPKGHTRLKVNDKLLLISDNDEELMEAYKTLGISKFSIEKNK